ncbi:hypothetical protein PIB30_051163 [Stylosanthes scabra]|uniref:Uncharacterized protein n=1 Tax=Stylosanthes scabra TaxID=79078 RepID=A0ABU6TIQ0_9FABA|nr:hypothetical protein [Stylosanthes scabra]
MVRDTTLKQDHIVEYIDYRNMVLEVDGHYPLISTLIESRSTFVENACIEVFGVALEGADRSSGVIKLAWIRNLRDRERLDIDESRERYVWLLPEDKYPDFWRLLDIQSLRPLLFLKERYEHKDLHPLGYYRVLDIIWVIRLVAYDDLDKDDNGEFQLEFQMAGTKYTLSLNEIATVSGLQSDDMLFKGGTDPPKRLKYSDGKDAQEGLLVSPLGGGK